MNWLIGTLVPESIAVLGSKENADWSSYAVDGLDTGTEARLAENFVFLFRVRIAPWLVAVSRLRFQTVLRVLQS